MQELAKEDKINCQLFDVLDNGICLKLHFFLLSISRKGSSFILMIFILDNTIYF